MQRKFPFGYCHNRAALCYTFNSNAAWKYRIFESLIIVESFWDGQELIQSSEEVIGETKSRMPEMSFLSLFVRLRNGPHFTRDALCHQTTAAKASLEVFLGTDNIKSLDVRNTRKSDFILQMCWWLQTVMQKSHILWHVFQKLYLD